MFCIVFVLFVLGFCGGGGGVIFNTLRECHQPPQPPFFACPLSPGSEKEIPFSRTLTENIFSLNEQRPGNTVSDSLDKCSRES